MTELSEVPVRELTAADLGRTPIDQPDDGGAAREGLASLISDEDPILQKTEDLLEMFGGVIFTGAPGTSKSWYAGEIALKLAKGREELVRFVQFHPSYQYEDFVQGYVPTDVGKFQLMPKHLMKMCEIARSNENENVVMVIDELSRADPGRVFGEALTYLEKSKRELEFDLAAGGKFSIPGNLIILATMNPLDRGVDEVDTAFDRRFAKIALDPDPVLLEAFLVNAGMDVALIAKVVGFFNFVNGQTRNNPFAAVGHTYFLGVSDADGLKRLWEHQLRFLFEKAFRIDPAGYDETEKRWQQIFS
jgi:5-methylcytosine-specific restriction protein B